MRVIRTENYEQVSRKAADLIAAQVQLMPDCVLGLATGSSPEGAYAVLAEKCRAGEVDFSQVKTVNLDEYVGLAPDHTQSYARFMRVHLFDHVNINQHNCHIPSGLMTDPEAACADYDRLIRSLGGTDLQLLGIGPNGHIGFNEPDEAFIPQTHCVQLTDATIDANARFFASRDEVPKQAYTMGIWGIMQARRVVLVASGAGKAQAVRDAFTGPITPKVPASILQLHPDFTLIADEAALSLAKGL